MNTRDGALRGPGLRVALVTGIYPPDIGGPATHVADLEMALTDRGHETTVVTLSDRPALEVSERRIVVPRRWSWPRRMATVTRMLGRHRRHYDVIYAAGLHPAAYLASRWARRPVVVRVVGDPAWERDARLSLTRASFDEFQMHRPPKPRLMLMRWLRGHWARCADGVVVPNAYLRSVVERWGVTPSLVHVVPNGVRIPKLSPPRHEAAEATGTLRVGFLGRLIRHKQVEILVEAIARAPGVTLSIVGDGPDRERLERLTRGGQHGERIRFHGALDHTEALGVLSTWDALVLPSAYEGLPHVVLEALALGVPVVTYDVGGVGEVVDHGVNGLVLDTSTPEAFAAAFGALRNGDGLRDRLAAGARDHADAWSFERSAGMVEGVLKAVVHCR